MRSLHDAGNLSGKKVFLRADLNVPVKDGQILDDFRIKKVLPTLDFLIENGAQVVMGSHFEGEGGSLLPVFEYLSAKYKIIFVKDFYPDVPPEIKDGPESGTIVLLENLRQYLEEKENSDEYAKHLASFADIFINEAFPVAHRKHASVVGIPKFIPGFAGFTFEEEIKELSRAFSPGRPFVFILGGAKFETKMPLIKKFFNIADKVFIGGALANDFFNAQGLSVGHSLLSSSSLSLEDFLTDKLMLPIDVRVDADGKVAIKNSADVSPHDYIVDVGSRSIENLRDVVCGAKFVLWNGPLGNYELGHREGTHDLARLIADCDVTSIVGGGDTVASIAELGLNDKFSFISTGGGAMLEFLANETLPGIEALE
jgi:phosphoglycerate kinase